VKGKGKRAGKNRARRSEAFVRGFVATGLLASLQTREPRALLRTSLQGGLALLAAAEIAHALERGRPAGGLLALAAGGAGLWLSETLMNPSTHADD